MALNIATAFRLRNKLKERIRKLTDIISGAEITKPVGTEEKTAALDGKTLNEVVENVRFLMATLREFNFAIDRANIVNKEDLISLETLKAEIAFYESLTVKVRNARTHKFDHNSEGGKDKIELEPLLDQQLIIAHFRDLKKQKEALEERLATSNGSTQVPFDRSIIDNLL